MSNIVPEGWNEFELKEIASPDDRYSFVGGPFGSSLKSEEYTDQGVRIIQLQNIGDGEFKDSYKIFTSPEKADELRSCNIYPGDIILSKMGDPVARAALIPAFANRYLMASDGIRLAVNREKFDAKFIHDAINSAHFRTQAELSSTGSTRKRIGLTTLRQLTLAAPPLPEQQKIAAILSSVDDVIEKTRAQINKLKNLKTGMMQELLTKGIGHTEFKDSPVGRIPAPWAVKTVGDLGAVVTGSTPKTASREYYGGSIPFISPSDINHSMYIRKTANSLTEAGLKETRELPAGTVCVVCIGSTIGKTGITTFRCATNQQVNAVICRGTHPEFVYYLLTYHSKVIKAEAGTQAVPIINKSSFSALPVQLPGYDEQVEIGNSIASVDSQTSFLESKLQSTTSLKKALMQDLLTGKVRVKVDQKESAVA